MKAAPVKRGRVVVATLAGVAAVALLAWGAWQAFGWVASQPLERVTLAGDVHRLAATDLEAFTHAVQAAPASSLDAIRARARRVPWVRDATVRRVFPDAVEVTFSAYTAFARWNDTALVSEAGEVFMAAERRELPRLRGPEGSAARVVQEYALVAAALAPIGASVKELTLTARGAWRATLDSGMSVALGRGDWRPRAERFVRAWPRLSPEAQASDYADLRYPGGFALKRTAKVTVVKP